MLRFLLGTVSALPSSIGVLSIGLAGACAPSFESVHEGNLRFEHCYRLDHDTEIPSSHREYCWNEWVNVYTYGQTLDRLNYASRRLRVLRGEPSPGATHYEPRVTQGEFGPEAPPVAVVPTAEASPAPPPPIPSDGPPTPTDAPSAKPELPLIACSRSCETALRECKENCQVAPKGCTPCDPTYKECLQHCFE